MADLSDRDLEVILESRRVGVDMGENDGKTVRNLRAIVRMGHNVLRSNFYHAREVTHPLRARNKK